MNYLCPSCKKAAIGVCVGPHVNYSHSDAVGHRRVVNDDDVVTGSVYPGTEYRGKKFGRPRVTPLQRNGGVS